MASTVLRGAYRFPSSRMAPSSGSYKPQSSFTSVDLPAPFWPARTCTSPRRIARSTRSNASTPGNRFVVPWNSMMSGGAALPRSTKWLFAWRRRRQALRAGLRRAGALHQVGRGDQLDGSLHPALQMLSLLHAEPGLDAVRCHLRPELVDGGQHLAVELHVEVDDGDPGLDRLLHRGDQPDRVGRGDADQIDLLGDEVLHGRDLRVDVGLGVHAHGHQGKGAVLRGELARAFLHALEELVRERLHHQADYRLLLLGAGRGPTPAHGEQGEDRQCGTRCTALRVHGFLLGNGVDPRALL